MRIKDHILGKKCCNKKTIPIISSILSKIASKRYLTIIKLQSDFLLVVEADSKSPDFNLNKIQQQQKVYHIKVTYFS